MGGNSFGTLFRVTTWGESHGKGIGVMVDGCPPRIEISEDEIQRDLDRRRPAQTPWSSPRREKDRVRILSGLFRGMTTGAPICAMIENEDPDPSAYDVEVSPFRPGHADITYFRKYGILDHRGGGRSSARETAARVIAGAVARKVLKQEGLEVFSYTKELGGVLARRFDLSEVDRNPFCCPDKEAAGEMVDRLMEAKQSGDSLGGVVEILASGCPAGLGEPVFDKLDADLAKALMSIGAVKAVEVGAGLDVARMKGSQCNDPIGPEGFLTNHAGGILGGISNGDHIVLRAAVKPIPSISIPQQTVNEKGEPLKISIRGRHDISAIPRINPVCEAMVCLVLVDHLLRWKAIR